MWWNNIWIRDFIDSIENKSDEEIKKIFENCTNEELINNQVVFLNTIKEILQENKKKSDKIKELIETSLKNNEEMSNIIKQYK
jgi:NurA-like 5'-3' nuclease